MPLLPLADHRAVIRFAKRRAIWALLLAPFGSFGAFTVALLVIIAGGVFIIAAAMGSSSSGVGTDPCQAGIPVAQQQTGGANLPASQTGTVVQPPVEPYGAANGEQAKPGVVAGPIPQNYLEMYQSAGEAFGIPWELLAAVGWEEMKHGAVTHTSPAGAIGPMQFMPQTWATYGVDGDGDGKIDPYSVADSIHAAANYLVASGVKGGSVEATKDAIWAYNHADWYVRDIIKFWNDYTTGVTVAGAVDAPTQGQDTGACAQQQNQAPAPGAPGSWVLPVQGAVLTSGFGPRGGSTHYGLDLAAPPGTPMYAAADGVVVKAGPASGFGLWVVIQHPQDNNVYSVYGHMWVMTVSEGQQVKAGQQIAEVGNNGISTGPHLHLEIQTGPEITQGKIDPAKYLTDRGVTLPS